MRLRLPEPAILWTFSSRLLGAVGSLAVIPLVLWHLRAEEQGVYYLFSSLLSAQVLLELGFAGVVIQRIAAAGSTAPDPWRNPLVSGLARLVMVWYGWLSAALVLFLLPGGWWYLSDRVDGLANIHWQGPWTILVFASALYVIGLGVSAIVEGAGRVPEVARCRTVASLARTATLAVGLIAGCGLWSVGMAVAVAAVALIGESFRAGGPAMRAAIRSPMRASVSWRRDILPFQWRIALSWASGFFIFQLMILAVGDRFGVVEAGRFGLAVQIAAGISALASSWISPYQTRWSQLAARTAWADLDASFRLSCLTSTGMALLGFLACTAILLAAPLVSAEHIHRLPSLGLWMLIGATAVTNQPVFAMATYLRAHGREPFLWSSMVYAALASTISLLAPSPFSICAFYLAANLLIGFWGWSIFRTKRRLWHNSPS